MTTVPARPPCDAWTLDTGEPIETTRLPRRFGHPRPCRLPRRPGGQKSGSQEAKPAPKKAAKKPAASAAGPREEEEREVLRLPEEPPAHWKTYDIDTDISLTGVNGKTRLWLPLAQYKDTLWEQSLGHRWQGNFATAGIYRDPIAEMEVFYADWPEGVDTPTLRISSRIATQNRHFDITRRSEAAERTEILRRCLRSTEQIQCDGIVRRTAERAIGRIKNPLACGKAIYDWVVENTVYDPTQKSIDNLPVAEMLESGRPVGRSADIALIFVGLCRAIGIPARPVFGLRMDGSRLFDSLGVSGDLSEAQHCRAEFYTPGYGWIPVDPSDVRKAIRKEHLGDSDSKLPVLKKLLFGFWEMNWIGYNAAQDVSLHGSSGAPLPYLNLPVVESREGRFDSGNRDHIQYKVSASRSES